MVRLSAVAFAAAFVVVEASFAGAQVLGPPMFEPSARTTAQGALVLRSMGACVDRLDPAAARALLRSAPRSKDEARLVNGMQSRLQECFHTDAVGIEFTATALRGATAEGAYLKAFPTRPDGALLSSGQAAVPVSWIEAYRKSPEIGPGLALHMTASCIVDAALGEADALVRSVPGSPEEGSGFDAVVTHVGPCVNQGRSFSVTKASLRALLAEALYDRFVSVGDVPVTVH